MDLPRREGKGICLWANSASRRAASL